MALLATSSADFGYRLAVPLMTRPRMIVAFQVWGVPMLPQIALLGSARVACTPLGVALQAVEKTLAAVEAQGLSGADLRIGAVMVGSGLMAVRRSFVTLSAFSSFVFEMVDGRGWACSARVVLALCGRAGRCRGRFCLQALWPCRSGCSRARSGRQVRISCS